MRGVRERALGRRGVADLGVEEDVRARLLPHQRRAGLGRLRGVGRRPAAARSRSSTSSAASLARSRASPRPPARPPRRRSGPCRPRADNRASASVGPSRLDQHDIGQPPLRLDGIVIEASCGIGLRPSALRSAPVSTASTPFSALARAVSMLLMRACACTGADHECARLARQIDVVAEAAGARDEARVLLAANGLTNASLHWSSLSRPIQSV